MRVHACLALAMALVAGARQASAQHPADAAGVRSALVMHLEALWKQPVRVMSDSAWKVFRRCEGAGEDERCWIPDASSVTLIDVETLAGDSAVLKVRTWFMQSRVCPNGGVIDPPLLVHVDRWWRGRFLEGAWSFPESWGAVC